MDGWAYSSWRGSGGGEVEGDRTEARPRLRLGFGVEVDVAGVWGGLCFVGRDVGAGLRLAGDAEVVVVPERAAGTLSDLPTFHGSWRGISGIERCLFRSCWNGEEEDPPVGEAIAFCVGQNCLSCGLRLAGKKAPRPVREVGF